MSGQATDQQEQQLLAADCSTSSAPEGRAPALHGVEDDESGFIVVQDPPPGSRHSSPDFFGIERPVTPIDFFGVAAAVPAAQQQLRKAATPPISFGMPQSGAGSGEGGNGFSVPGWRGGPAGSGQESVALAAEAGHGSGRPEDRAEGKDEEDGSEAEGFIVASTASSGLRQSVPDFFGVQQPVAVDFFGFARPVALSAPSIPILAAGGPHRSPQPPTPAISFEVLPPGPAGSVVVTPPQTLQAPPLAAAPAAGKQSSHEAEPEDEADGFIVFKGGDPPRGNGTPSLRPASAPDFFGVQEPVTPVDFFGTGGDATAPSPAVSFGVPPPAPAEKEGRTGASNGRRAPAEEPKPTAAGGSGDHSPEADEAEGFIVDGRQQQHQQPSAPDFFGVQTPVKVDLFGHNSLHPASPAPAQPRAQQAGLEQRPLHSFSSPPVQSFPSGPFGLPGGGGGSGAPAGYGTGTLQAPPAPYTFGTANGGLPPATQPQQQHALVGAIQPKRTVAAAPDPYRNEAQQRTRPLSAPAQPPPGAQYSPQGHYTGGFPAAAPSPAVPLAAADYFGLQQPLYHLLDASSPPPPPSRAPHSGPLSPPPSSSSSHAFSTPSPTHPRLSPTAGESALFSHPPLRSPASPDAGGLPRYGLSAEPRGFGAAEDSVNRGVQDILRSLTMRGDGGGSSPSYPSGSPSSARLFRSSAGQQATTAGHHYFDPSSSSSAASPSSRLFSTVPSSSRNSGGYDIGTSRLKHFQG